MTLVHRHTTERTLNGVRLFVAAIWLFKTATTPWSDIAELPLSLYSPVGPHRWLSPDWWPVLLSAPLLDALRWMVLAALAATLVPRLRGVAFLVAAVVITHHQALIHGFGFVNHQELVALYSLYILGAFSLWVREPTAEERGLPIVLILSLLCTSYVLAGVYRIVLRPDIFTDPGSMMGWVLINSARPLHYGFDVGLGLPWGPWLAYGLHAGFILVTALELLAPLALVSRWFRWFFLAVMVVPFHLGCLVLMNIFFWENAALLLLFLEWDRSDSIPEP